jgi:hypothetical protein
MLYADMSPEVKDLLTDCKLKPVGECQGEDHRSHADHGRGDRQPDDKPGEGSFPVKGDSTGNEGCGIQYEMLLSGQK